MRIRRAACRRSFDFPFGTRTLLWMVLQVKVKVRARTSELIGPVARHFRCPKAAVSIKSGTSGQRKLMLVNGA